MNQVETFVKEKTREQLQELHISNQEEVVEIVSQTILRDEQFWKLFNSLFASYIMTYAESNRNSFIPVQEATN